MTTDRELFQMALEALEDYIPEYDKRISAITALRERLSHCDRCGKTLGDADHIHTCTPQHTKKYVTQEPVAWMVKAHGVAQKFAVRADVADEWASQWSESDPGAYAHPLYTAPQRREWRGLSDEQIEVLYNAAPAKRDGWNAFARAIEAKLKEKNNG